MYDDLNMEQIIPVKARHQHADSDIRYRHSAFVYTVTTAREVTREVPEFLCEEFAFLTLFLPFSP
jgi:hypothetical protein